eukprot:gene12219-25652_t
MINGVDGNGLHQDSSHGDIEDSLHADLRSEADQINEQENLNDGSSTIPLPTLSLLNEGRNLGDSYILSPDLASLGYRVVFPQIFELRKFQETTLGWDNSSLNLTQKGLGLDNIDRAHHLTLMHGKDCVKSFRVRICRRCTGHDQTIDLGTYTDIESAVLVNDAHEICNGRFDKLLALRPQDRPYFCRLTANTCSRRKLNSRQHVLDIIEWRRKKIMNNLALTTDSSTFDNINNNSNNNSNSSNNNTTSDSQQISKKSRLNPIESSKIPNVTTVSTQSTALSSTSISPLTSSTTTMSHQSLHNLANFITDKISPLMIPMSELSVSSYKSCNTEWFIEGFQYILSKALSPQNNIDVSGGSSSPEKVLGAKSILLLCSFLSHRTPEMIHLINQLKIQCHIDEDRHLFGRIISGFAAVQKDQCFIPQ